MRQSFAVLCLLLAGAAYTCAQVAPSATARQLSITAGGMGSVFQPDNFEGGVAGASPYWLLGMGAYVDVKFTRWVQVEAEGRWLRFNQYNNIHQDNYLIGPRVPIHRLGRFVPYGKVLFGFSKMNLQQGNVLSGRFTDIAFGGGVDVRVSRRITLRAGDFEYQYWPKWLGGTLSPYGASVGIGYRVF